MSDTYTYGELKESFIKDILAKAERRLEIPNLIYKTNVQRGEQN
jgi:hypothetical protein